MSQRSTQKSHSEEESLGKVYDRILMGRLFEYIAPYRALMAAGIVLLLLLSLVELSFPYLTKTAIDGPFANSDWRGLMRISIIFLALQLVAFFLRFAQIYTAQSLGQRIIFDLRRRILQHIHDLDMETFDRQPVGRLMTRVTNDVEVLNQLFTTGLVNIAGDLITLLGIVIILFLLNVELATVSLIVVPLLFIATHLFRSKVRKAFVVIRVKTAALNSFIQESTQGIALIQVMRRERHRYGQFKTINGEYRDAYVRSIFYYAVFFPLVDGLEELAVALVLGYGGAKIIGGILTFGALVAFIQYSQRFFRPIRDLTERYNTLQSAMAAAERIFALLDTEGRIQSDSKPYLPVNVLGGVEFRNVSFAYRADQPVLEDVSFNVNPGETIAIVGPTGAGKTTISSLLTRFYEIQTGAILLDGIDIRKWDLVALRHSVGIVLQDAFLFSGTVAENIRLRDSSIPYSRMEWAARQVQAHELIQRLPKGYDTPIGERGARLSVGERQLLAFARALVFDPPLLVLDEATSSIDSETEARIQLALRRLASDRTSILIAHRLSTIRDAGKIIVLNKGRLIDQGPHEELVQRCSIYKTLYELQIQESV
ncbi:MAG: ABC transporter ATP-binding protein/permease [Candidatus Eisenbacteria bacterium]|uniref:ABC transporter ATP-binding protein/permease n=1 Tax=Eiseniibacteriota bacterium TaxID=2212470 RepID=A0A948RXF3_UNCEI|nr:ABC transporter ATP-binding protein/permease [Candidatus Eisenbacteria bacterium]MBU1949444.1 ABC transporter ATP-binding protein/permease [Candidatus Eisenbacteria bacterium]MBU2691318.1 ABC transporter ATP-binding protein/permease [Candidatus Eisenbacteria bacterium]